MKFKKLEDKLELYYDKIKHPSKIIGDWAIIDIDAYNRINKTTLTNICDVNNYLDERVVIAESKKYLIAIKYTPNFIASKFVDTEYDLILKDWDLIAVDREFLYKGNRSKILSNKELIALIGFKLSKKAKVALNDFE